MRRIILLLICAASVRADGSGFASLRIGAEGRSGGLGNAGAAWAVDAAAAYRNPSLLASGPGRETGFSMNRWVFGVKSGFLAFAFRGEDSGFGFHLLYTDIPGIEYRTTASDQPLGRFSADETVAAVSYGRKIRGGFSAGVSLKGYHAKVFADEAMGLGLDAGLSYAPRAGSWRTALAVQNLGRTSDLAAEPVTLPLSVTAGAVWPLSTAAGIWTLVADAVHEKDGRTFCRAGAEFAWRNTLFLRGGIQTGSETLGPAGGAGFASGRLRVDYAFLPLRHGLGESHRFSFNLSF